MTKKNVYILFTDTGTLFTKTIKLYTGEPYNHASISFDENLEKLYSFGRKSPKNPFIGGFVKENIETGLFKNATCAVYRLTVTETEYDSMRQYIKEIDAQKENYRYNFIGLFAIIFNRQLEREYAFFCSEFVASVLKQSGSIDFKMPISLVTPHDLQVVENLDLVYQGKLKNYKKGQLNQHHIDMIGSSANMISA